MYKSYLAPSSESTDADRTKECNQLVGSLTFLVSMTRPDIAHTHSVHARHLQNLGQQHLRSVRKVWEYIAATKYLALCATVDQEVREKYVSRDIEKDQEYLYPGEPIFFEASEAAFGDDIESRRSSQEYLYKLYGMTIDWKAKLQRCVTKATTEAELISCPLPRRGNGGAKSSDLRIDQRITIHCDNQQTVGAITKIDEKLQMKLKHVDIHNMWLRQQYAERRIHDEWKPTAEMPADELTKALPRLKHQEFVRQLETEDLSAQFAASNPSIDLQNWSRPYGS